MSARAGITCSLALAALLLGCGASGDGAPPAGPPLAEGTASFARIQAQVLAPSCTASGCHAGSAPDGGLSLSPDVAYDQLVGARPTNGNAANDGLKRVMPGKPDSSLLYHKLVFPAGHHASDYGNPMPTGTAGLSVGVLEYVRQWIAAGAPRTGMVADASLLADRTPQTALPFAPLPAPPAGTGFQLKVDRFDVAATFERELFVYRKLGNPSDIYVSRIETSMRPFSHHFLLYTFNDAALASPALLPAPDVVRDIRMPDGTLNLLAMLPMAYHVFFGGSMAQRSSYTFPAGTALRLPASAAIDLNVHYANKTTSVVPGEAYANLYTVPLAQVQHVVSTLNLSNTSFSLPAGQRTTVEKSFTFGARTTIVALTSHMHARGEQFQIRLVGGARDGEVVYSNTDWEHPALITFPVPIVLEKGQGLRSVVTWNNTTTRAIGFGLTSEDEMAIIFGYYY